MRHLVPLALLAVAAPAQAQKLEATKGADAVEFVEKADAGTAVVTRYQFGGQVNVPGKDKVGKKDLAKPFFYPLHAPGDVPVTRGWPIALGVRGDATTDHVHQKSVWFCHGDVIPDLELKVRSADKNVKGIDFWAEGGNHGRIVCTKVGDPKQVSPTHVSVATVNEWRAADGTKVLDEARTLHVQLLPAGRLVVFEIDLHAADCAVTFGDTKEGSMGVRVSDEIRLESKGGGTVTSSDGVVVPVGAKGNLPVWGKPADWHDYSGLIGGKSAGLAVFDDPANPHRALWHTRSYGLMAANPFGRAASGFPAMKGKTDVVRLAKGERLKLRYGVYAHAGDATTGKVAEAFKAFAGK